MRLFLHCDNYAKCQQTVRYLDSDKKTEEHARAKGWHIWFGQTMGNKTVKVVLCAKCVGTNRSRVPDQRLPGDQELIQLEVQIGDGDD